MARAMPPSEKIRCGPAFIGAECTGSAAVTQNLRWLEEPAPREQEGESTNVDLSESLLFHATETVAEQFTHSPAIIRRMRLIVSQRLSKTRVTKRANHRRSHIVATDIRDAFLSYQIPSDEALQQAFQPTEKDCAVQHTATVRSKLGLSFATWRRWPLRKRKSRLANCRWQTACVVSAAPAAASRLRPVWTNSQLLSHLVAEASLPM